MTDWPQKVGHLVFYGENDPGKTATYKCTLDDCGALVVRKLNNIKTAKINARASACKVCVKKLMRRGMTRLHAGCVKRTVRPREG